MDADSNRISILRDGNCFFRCVSSFVNKRLLNGERFKNGKIKNKDLSNIETKNSISLRDMVCSKIKSEKDKYTDNVYYEDDLYENLDDRIRKMERPGEFAGFLEVEAASKLFKMCFNIFMPIYDAVTKDLVNYNLVSKIGGNYKRECNLVLEYNHYEILYSNVKLCESGVKTRSQTEKSSIKTKTKEYEKSDRVLRKRKKIKYN